MVLLLPRYLRMPALAGEHAEDIMPWSVQLWQLDRCVADATSLVVVVLVAVLSQEILPYTCTGQL